MRFSAITLFVPLSALAGTTALAQSLDQQWAFCENASKSYSHDQRIAGCGSIIQLGKDSAQNLAIAYSNRGVAYATKQDLTRAISDYDQAIRLNPQYATAYNNRGLAYRAKQDLTRAIADYDQAIRLNPQHATAYYNRGLVLVKLGRKIDGEADISKAKTLDPKIGK